MVKIRLRRIGSKGRPFYRVVVSKSTSARNGAFVETLGTYDPVVKPTLIKIDEEKALQWLMSGAQPTETTAILLSKTGVLDKFFEQRPKAKQHYKFLDKRTSAMSVQSAIGPQGKAKAEAAAPAEAAPAPAPEPEAAAPAPEPEVEAIEAPAEAIAEAPAGEAPAAEAAPTEEPAAEEPAAEAAPAEEPAADEAKSEEPS